VLLDADIERVVDALRSPDLLGAWLGNWTPDGDDSSSATVVTDDGRTRRVEHLAPTPDGAVRWRWAPVADPTLVSEVRFTVTREAGRTRLTVTETLLAGHGASGRPGTAGAACPTAAARGLHALQ